MRRRGRRRRLGASVSMRIRPGIVGGGTRMQCKRNANASGWERRQTPWDTQRQQQQAQARGSSPYSDPSGVALEEWRRGTDEEAPRNTLPPPSPVTSPGMLSPNDPRPNVHQQTSQESFNSNLRRSSSGSSERTVNITIVPPSRPPSTGHSSGLPTEPRFLSPHHVGGTPVVPEEDEDDEEDEDEESDGSDAMPPGYVMGPLPAFAQGVTYPPGFVPMSVGPAPIGLPLVGVDGQIMAQPPGVRVQGPQAQVLQNAQMQNAQMQSQVPMPMQSQPPIQMGAGTTGAPVREWRASEQQLQQPRPASRQGGGIYGANGNGTATWTAPPLIGANAMEPARPPSRQMGAILGNPATNVVWGANALGAQLSRPSSRQGGMLGNPNPVNAARAAFTVEPARPSSRLGNPNPGNAGRGGAPPLTVEPVARPLSRQMGGMPGNTNANATAWGGAPPLTAERPSSRQGGMLGNPNALAQIRDGVGRRRLWWSLFLVR
ncbi:hypothetical protein B0H13DRAFT_2402533 [Mycena leptocephala]|nr:hypothetical protein B0H13DRAFT_2402533 [Mycena leptocephala]